MRDVNNLNTTGMTKEEIHHLRESFDKDTQRIAHGHRHDGWIIAGCVAFALLWGAVALFWNP